MRNFIAAFLFASFALGADAQSWVNGQAARAVVGQQEFTFGAYGTYQYLVGGTSGIAWANGQLFVADANKLAASPVNNRIIVFNTTQIPPANADVGSYASSSPYCGLCGYSAVNVLGQPDYISSNPGRSNTPTGCCASTSEQGTMQNPTSVATDGHVLAVADTDNNRVLIWTSMPTSIAQPANIVLGTPDFTSPPLTTNTTQNDFRGPQGVWIQNGKLFVADTENDRILIWNSIPTQNNQNADVVIGKPNFTTGRPPQGGLCDPNESTTVAAANALCSPVGVSSDGTRLIVSDLGFNRVVIWNTIPTSNDQPADLAVGQPDLSSATGNNPAVCTNSATLCAATLNQPRAAISDGTHLYVADSGDDRVLIFNTIPTTSGASADEVLGQPDFASDVDTSANSSTDLLSTAIDNTGSVDTIPTPSGLAWDGSNLYVSDPYNRRVLVFSPANTPLPDNSVLNNASEIIRQEGIVTLTIPTDGGIVANDTVTVTLGNAAAATTEPYTYTIKSTDTLDTIAQALVSAINANGGDANAIATFAGTGTGSVYLSSRQVNLGFDAITLAVSESNSADILPIASGSYLTAGTAATGAPGMLVEIDGTNLSDQPAGIPLTATPPLPTNFGGTQVFMDGIAVPIQSVSSTQIIAQVPYWFTNETAPSGSIGPNTQYDRNSSSVYVRTVHSDGSVTVTNPTPLYLAPANPGLYGEYENGQPIRVISGALHQSGNANAVVSIDGSVTAGDQLTITINGKGYTYTVLSTDTLASIVTAFVNMINGADPYVSASAGAAFTRVVLTALQPGAAGVGITIAGSTSSTSATETVTPYSSTTCCNVIPNSLITQNNPALPGEEITVFGDGLGLLTSTPLPVEGQPYTGTPANTVANEVIATLNGTTAEVIGAGLNTGSVGQYAVQLVVPTGVTGATPSLYIAQNDFISNTVELPLGTGTNGSTSTGSSSSSAPPNEMALSIDYPNSSSTLTGVAAIGGWALDINVAMTSVNIYVDGQFVGTAVYGTSAGARPDVCAVFPTSPNCPNVGWNYALNTTVFADGTHTLEAIGSASDGNHYTLATSFNISNGSANPENPTRAYIDQPGPSNTPYQGLVTFSGWAENKYGLAISSVQLAIDGAPIGTAMYGGSDNARADVCAMYPQAAGCPDVGWTALVDTTKWSNGTHTVSATATASDGSVGVFASTFTVSNFSSANPMTLTIDAPNPQSGAYSGTVGFAGWAIDNNAPITEVQIAIDGVSYGDASYGFQRSDVCSVYPGRPNCPYVGWNISIDTTTLGDGTHTLTVTGLIGTGQRSSIDRTFTVANLTSSNPLKISIDTPAPNAAALSGTAAPIGGWALSLNDTVSTVQILVDGVVYGSAVYGGNGGSRPDVCAIYTSSPNCQGSLAPDVGWNYGLDTTLFANGSHVLEVTATTASGERGTASQAFTVSNAVSTGPLKLYIDQPNTQSTPFQGLAVFSGWAIDGGSTITRVAVSIDGVPTSNAVYGTSRADVCSAFPGQSGCPNVGWTTTVDTTQLADGSHTVEITAYGGGGTHSTISSTFSVDNWSIINPITIDIDTPATNGGPYYGVQVFGGWVSNPDGPISSVSVSVDGVPFPGASYGVSRPDVCASYPNSVGCPNVGWNILLDTSLIPNGNHTLAVTALTLYGQSATMTRQFTVAN